MKVTVYEGQRQTLPGMDKRPVVTAADLATFDVVLTTYEVRMIPRQCFEKLRCTDSYF